VLKIPHLIAGACILLLFGVVQALTINRADANVDFKRLADGLGAIPLVMSDWQGEDLEADALAARVADCEGMLQRRYTSNDGREISLMILVGRPGPLSVHLPEFCYRGLGYEEQGPTQHREFDSSTPSATFRVVNMENSRAIVPRHIRVYHSWNNGSGWSAPATPRLAFARASYLYKLYVTPPPSSSPLAEDKDVCADFIRACLPAIDDALFLTHKTE
jgi:hypothetical protein